MAKCGDHAVIGDVYKAAIVHCPLQAQNYFLSSMNDLQKDILYLPCLLSLSFLLQSGFDSTGRALHS
eukprot:2351468-Amphidinium_carterae.1